MGISVNSNLGGTAAGLSGGVVTAGTAKRQTLFSSSSKSKKKLNYNSKEISSQLIRASKSRTASSVLTRAKNKVSALQRCLGTGQYDDGEVRIAIAHAKRMVKCAQSKVRNLKEEENLQHKYEREKANKERQQKNEVKRRVHQKEQNLGQKMATEEIQQIQKEKARKQEVLRKRRLHRNQERGKISEADMKYLQNTIDYMKSGGQVDTSAVSVDLTDAGVMMSELQQLEQQVENEVENEMADIETTDVSASADVSGGAATGTVQGSGVIM